MQSKVTMTNKCTKIKSHATHLGISGTGEVFLTLDIQLRLHDALRNYARTLEIANKKVSEVVELGWHIGVLRAVTHVTQGPPCETRVRW